MEKQELRLDDGAVLSYQYLPVRGSGNHFIPTRYRTQIWIVSGNKEYDMGWYDEKLDEEQIKARFTEIMRVHQERKYGQQSTFLRRELTPRRDRGKVGTDLQRAAHRQGYPSIP